MRLVLDVTSVAIRLLSCSGKGRSASSYVENMSAALNTRFTPVNNIDQGAVIPGGCRAGKTSHEVKSTDVGCLIAPVSSVPADSWLCTAALVSKDATVAQSIPRLLPLRGFVAVGSGRWPPFYSEVTA
jgi:hypothetical protein